MPPSRAERVGDATHISATWYESAPSAVLVRSSKRTARPRPRRDRRAGHCQGTAKRRSQSYSTCSTFGNGTDYSSDGSGAAPAGAGASSRANAGATSRPTLYSKRTVAGRGACISAARHIRLLSRVYKAIPDDLAALWQHANALPECAACPLPCSGRSSLGQRGTGCHT